MSVSLARAVLNFLQKGLTASNVMVADCLMVVAQRPIDLAEDQVGQIDAYD
jgi:hypothetical protein